MKRKHSFHHRAYMRHLRFEGLEGRVLMAADLDDSLAESKSLGAITTAGRSVSSSISPDTDVDMYRFTVTAGQTIDFDIDTPFNGPGGLGSYLRLFNSSGQQLAFNDDAIAPGENPGFDAYLRFTFTLGGTYFIGVSNFNNTFYDPRTGNGDVAGGLHTTGSYQLNLQALPVDTNDAINEAVSLGAVSTTPRTVSEAISPDVDVDMFRFTVIAGQTVDFDIDTTTNGPGGLGSFLRLFTSTGQQLDFNDDGAAPGEVVGFDSYLRFTFNTSGTFFIAVSNNTNTQYSPVNGGGDLGGGLHSVGAYQLTLQVVPPPSPDLDDSFSEARQLGAISTTPAVVFDTISPDTDVDMYRFSVTAGQTVDFDIDTTLNGPGGLGSYLRLFNSSGQQLAFNNDGAAPGETLGFDAYLRFTFVTGGTYFVAVSNANNIFYNPINGTGDAAGGLNSIGGYQLTVQTVPPPAADPDDTLSEAPLLGPISTTPTIVSDSISADTDVDIFRFTATAGQTVDFDIDTTANGPGGLGSFLRLFNASGQQLAFNNDAAAPGEAVVGFDAYLRFTFNTAGTYFIAVSNANNTVYNPLNGTGDVSGGANSVGAYQLTVQGVAPPAPDGDDALIEAVSLGSITTSPVFVSDSISQDIDVDMYRFTVTAGQTVDFDIDTPLNGPGGLGSYLRLFNSSGQQLAFNDDAIAPGEAPGFDAYLRFTFTTGGTYFLGVSNFNNVFYNALTGNGDTAGGQHATGVYQLTVQALPVDTNDAIPEAVFLGAASTTPRVVSDAISPDVDVDMYRFTAVAGQTVDFDIDTAANGPGGLGSFLRLFTSTGQQLSFNDDAAAPGEATVGFDAYLRFTFATSGTYFIGVSNWTNTQYSPVNGAGDLGGGLHSIGAYQLTMQAVPAGSPLLLSATQPATGGTSSSTLSTRSTSASPAISSSNPAAVFPFQSTAPERPAISSMTSSRTMPQPLRNQSIASLDAFFAELGR